MSLLAVSHGCPEILGSKPYNLPKKGLIHVHRSFNRIKDFEREIHADT